MEIRLSDLSFSYKKKSPMVIDGLSATLEAGRLYSLTGANGCGKTTLGKLILGLVKPRKGEILFDGADVKRVSAGRRAEKIGYLFQNPDMQLFAPTVWEELCFPFRLKNQLTPEKEEELRKLLDVFGLTGTEERFPLTMSGGEKQRLAIATIMSRNVEFLIFDEPSAWMDADGRRFLTDFINGFVEKGGGAIVISHDEEFLSELNVYRELRLSGGAFV